MSSLAPSFLIESSAFLQVTRSTIESQKSLKFGQISLRAAGLVALGKPHRLITGKML